MRVSLSFIVSKTSHTFNLILFMFSKVVGEKVDEKKNDKEKDKGGRGGGGKGRTKGGKRDKKNKEDDFFGALSFDAEKMTEEEREKEKDREEKVFYCTVVHPIVSF